MSVTLIIQKRNICQNGRFPLLEPYYEKIPVYVKHI